MVKQSYRSLQELVIQLSGADVSDESRKRRLLRYVNETRQRLIRLLVLVSWHKCEANKVSVLEQCMALLQGCEDFTLGLRTASDNLALLHDELRNLFQPNYDTRTALDVLCNRSLPLMPSAMDDLVPGFPSAPAAAPTQESEDAAVEAALKRVSTLTYERLLSVRDELVAKFGVELTVANGRGHVTSPGVFELVVCLDPTSLRIDGGGGESGGEGKGNPGEDTTKWVVAEVKLLMAEAEGAGGILSDYQLGRLRFQLQQLLQAPEKVANPLVSLVACLTDLSARLMFYACSSQLSLLVSETLGKGKLRRLVQKEEAAQGNTLRCLYWVKPTKSIRTFVEFTLSEGEGFRCENDLEHDHGRQTESAIEIATEAISVEDIVWQGAKRMAGVVANRIAREFEKSKTGLDSLQVSSRHGEVRFTADGCLVLGLEVDTCTGVLVLASNENEWKTPRMAAHIGAFTRKHVKALASAAEVLASDLHLGRLVCHLSDLVHKIHAAMVYDEISTLVLLQQKSPQKWVEVDLNSAESAKQWREVTMGFRTHHEVALLHRRGTEEYAGICIGREVVVVCFARMHAKEDGASSLRVKEREIVGEEFKFELFFMCTPERESAPKSSAASRKRKLEGSPQPKASARAALRDYLTRTIGL